jgi:hypothetical protein
MRIEENPKLGHQAPKGWRRNECNSILIEGDLHYCWSHNFMYNEEEEERKLYNGEACYYTDNRFYTPFGFNFYKDAYLFNRRFSPISIKAAIRRTLKCKGIPVGTIVQFQKSYYHPGKKINNSYLFKIRKENPIDIKYEINMPSYSANFSTCKRSQELVDALRANGFIVSVRSENENFISSMISSAGKAIGKDIEVNKEDGEVAIAYGHGKKIGFSSYDNTVFGYSDGVENILWDEYGCFDKWSRCNWIKKTTPISEVIEILTTPNPDEDED